MSNNLPIDKTLVGSNFCGLECANKDNTIHPQTCASQVLKSCNTNNFTLVDWINEGIPSDTTFELSTSLLTWLEANYSIDFNIPIADDDTIGGIKLGANNEFLEVDNEGILTFKSSALPTIEKASFETLGAIKLGNDSIMEDVEFNSSLYPITEDNYYCLPLVRDNSNDHRAGIAIPKELFNSTQVQVNWNESDSTSLSYILNKPTIPEAYVLPMASDESLGGIKVGYVSTENNKAVNINASGEAYVQTYNPKSNIINCGLSQHYFDIYSSSTGLLFIPLFKVDYNVGPRNIFHVNTRFEIIGLRTQSYYGEFLLNYTYNPTSVLDYCEDLITINLVGNSILAQTDVIAVKGEEKGNPSITVYRVMQTPTNINHNMFMVNILSSNIPDSGNTITYYYCTDETYVPDNNEVGITLANIPTQRPDPDNEINLVPTPSSN